MAVYGKQIPPFNENMVPSPIDPYGIAKFSVEQDIISANNQFGLKYNIIRPHNVLGIYQNIWDRYRNVIGIFIRRVLNGEPILIYGDGEQTRAFSDVKYYMEVFENLILKFDNQTYNIGAEKYYSINEIATRVQNIGIKFGYHSNIEYGEERHEVKHAYCDHTKAIQDLKFTDNTNINELIENLFIWAMSQPNRMIKNMNYEVDKNIYKYWQ
jgi:UDP-glucose 4-epimerase